MSRKRHKFIGRTYAGEPIRLARRPKLLFDIERFRRAWTQPPKPWKDKRRGWVNAPRGGWKPSEGKLELTMTLEWTHPDA